MRTRTYLIPLLLPTLLLPAAAMAETCHMQTPSGYGKIGGSGRIGPYPSRAACESVNRQSFGGGGRCSCSADGGAGTGSGMPAGGDPQLMMMQMFMQFGFDLLGKQLECLANPDCDANAQQRQLAEQQRLLQEQERQQQETRQRAVAEERQRYEAERRARLEDTKARLFGEMRLQPGSGDLKPRDIGLDTRGGTGGLQPRPLAAGPSVGAAALRAPLARASCGAYLLRKADEAALRGDLQEAGFLSSEAAALMTGEKVTTAVECPPPPEVPEIGEGVAIVSEEARAAQQQFEASLQQRSRFMSAMYQRVAEQSAAYRQTVADQRAAEAREQEARARLDEARAARAAIESAPTATAPDPAARSALAEALAAMEAAEAAYGDAQAQLNTLAETRRGQEQDLQRTRSLFDDVKKDPQAIDKALKALEPAKGMDGGMAGR